ncbi:MAG: helix-turn-helix domain-containing protein [Patescibacteria group bacterium]
MDEILIDERKYVSSKRAAKITGYAKDYIGQLCREGRVPARLVGRSWYVLESAIEDHRFGEKVEREPQIKEMKEKSDESLTLRSTWESPHYEATQTEVLPSINRLKNPPTTPPEGSKMPQETIEDQRGVIEHLQNSWKEWFDRTVKDEEVQEQQYDSRPDELSVEQTTPTHPEMGVIMDEGEVAIPVHTIYDLPPQDLLPHHSSRIEIVEPEEISKPAEPELAPVQRRKFKRGALYRAFITFVLLATFAIAGISVLGSGFIDYILFSHTRAGYISGFSVYIK